MYEFVEREKTHHPVRRICRVLGVSPSGYWAWRRREPSARVRANAQLQARIVQIHRASRGTYGALRVHAELLAAGTPCGHNRVSRLMRQAGWSGVIAADLFRQPDAIRALSQRPISCSAPSAHLLQISSGLQTLRMSRPVRDSSTWR